MGKLARTLATLTLVVLAACGGNQADDAQDSNQPEAEAGESPAAVAEVTIVAPADGASVSSPVNVKMSAAGVEIEPAADGVKEGSGHFHIIVDAECVTAGEVIPADETHIHYGMAQTEAQVPLTPGQHTLCVQVGDAAHVATDVTEEISVVVQQPM